MDLSVPTILLSWVRVSSTASTLLSFIVKFVLYLPCEKNQKKLKGHSHYCVFRVRLWQTVAFPQGDRKFPISALTQPTAENADRCVYCESALKEAGVGPLKKIRTIFCSPALFPNSMLCYSSLLPSIPPPPAHSSPLMWKFSRQSERKLIPAKSERWV